MALCLNRGPLRWHESAWSPKTPMGASHCGHLQPAVLGSRLGIPDHHRINCW